jgi:hypothetical protein
MVTGLRNCTCVIARPDLVNAVSPAVRLPRAESRGGQGANSPLRPAHLLPLRPIVEACPPENRRQKLRIYDGAHDVRIRGQLPVSGHGKALTRHGRTRAMACLTSPLSNESARARNTLISPAQRQPEAEKHSRSGAVIPWWRAPKAGYTRPCMRESSLAATDLIRPFRGAARGLRGVPRTFSEHRKSPELGFRRMAWPYPQRSQNIAARGARRHDLAVSGNRGTIRCVLQAVAHEADLGWQACR